MKLSNFISNRNSDTNDKKIEEINEIELRSISFSYDNTSNKVLDNINLKLKKGDLIEFLVQWLRQNCIS